MIALVLGTCAILALLGFIGLMFDESLGGVGWRFVGLVLAVGLICLVVWWML